MRFTNTYTVAKRGILDTAPTNIPRLAWAVKIVLKRVLNCVLLYLY